MPLTAAYPFILHRLHKAVQGGRERPWRSRLQADFNSVKRLTHEHATGASNGSRSKVNCEGHDIVLQDSAAAGGI